MCPGQIVVLADLLYTFTFVVPIGGMFKRSVAAIRHRLCVTCQCVPLISAELPRQLGLEAGKGIEERPCDDHIVVDGDKERDKKHAIALDYQQEV